MRKLVTGLVFILFVGGFGFLWLFSKSPEVQFQPDVKSVGAETPVKVRVASPHGVRKISGWIEQNGAHYNVFEASVPARRWSFFRDSEAPREFSFTAGKKNAAELKEGPARLVVEAVANDFAAKAVRAANDVQVNLQPPIVSADANQHYVNQGGSELVAFTIGGSWDEAGVRVGKYTFRSFPLPGKGPNERFSLFAFPWDVPSDTIPVVYARNASGTESTARFWFRLFPKQFRSRELTLDDRFLSKVTNELDPIGTGSLLDRFLKINGEMRQQNNQVLSDLRLKTEPKMLWQGPFFRLGKVESFFADSRTYLYNGKKVDQQMHLGFDLSDVQGAPVRAANSGKVIHAGPLGIYGNCVVIDHGYGLQSIYGHMRKIEVNIGDSVGKEQVLGRTGDTGLAGGDHLHYSMQVDGVQVNPLEWWDDHWIKDRILSKLPAGS